MMHAAMLLYLLLPLSQGYPEILNKLAVANNELAVKLYKRLSIGSSGNIFFSPISISSALGMIFYGAQGSTAEELSNVLGFRRAELSDDMVHSLFHDFLNNLEPSSNSESILNVVNAILLDKQLDIFSSYKNGVETMYKALVQEVDFAQDGDKIVDEINTWIQKNTNGKIDNFLNVLDSSNVMVFLNAVYFNGTWKTKFDPSGILPDTFYNGGLKTNVVEVPTMHILSEFPFAAQNDMKILELPYKSEHISMLILLPNQKDGLVKIEESLTPEMLTKIREKLSVQEVRIALPKFKLEYSRELSSDFQALGAKSMFKAGVANFSGMTKNTSVVVSQIVHKAVVTVNEKGSEASGATGIVYGRSMTYQPAFKADHPFLFAIVDKRSDMILFVGRVNKL